MSFSDLFVRLLAALLMVGMPVILAVWLKQTLPSKWRFFGVGAVTFVVSQILHVPFNAFLLLPLCDRVLGLDIQQDRGWKLALFSICLGLSAGVFEELCRYAVWGFFVRQSEHRTYSTAVMLGIGHGGCESIIVGVLAVATLVQMSILRHYQDDLGKIGIPDDQIEKLQQLIDDYWGTPYSMIMMAPLERVIAITLHLSLSVLVWLSVKRSNLTWLAAAILFHATVDAVAVFVLQTVNAYVVELILVLTGLPLSVYILWYYFREYDNTPEFLPVSQTENVGEEDVALPGGAKDGNEPLE